MILHHISTQAELFSHLLSLNPSLILFHWNPPISVFSSIQAITGCEFFSQILFSTGWNLFLHSSFSKGWISAKAEIYGMLSVLFISRGFIPKAYNSMQSPSNRVLNYAAIFLTHHLLRKIRLEVKMATTWKNGSPGWNSSLVSENRG